MQGSRSDRARIAKWEDTPEWATPIITAVNNHADDLKSLDGAISLAKNTNCEVRELSFQMPSLPPAVTSGIIASDWGQTLALVPSGVMMLPGGEVRGFGSLTGITIAAGATLLLNLPEGWRPNVATAIPVASQTAVGLVTISAAGVLNYVSGPTGAPVVSLDPIRFWAGPQAAPPSQFSGNGWPLYVSHKLGVLSGIIPMRCVLLDSPGQTAGQGLPYLDWANIEGGKARLNSAWGLQWGKRYRLTALLVPQE